MFADMIRWGTESPDKLPADDRYFRDYHPMMLWAGNNSGALWIFGLLWIVTWILVIVVLIALVRWLWKKGDKVR
ncbi:MAG: hypothetical protein UT92_C0013G0011 [Candidatus Curtissbacteria bacterium GW2011_GWA1_40_24]|uniref:Uncharacterized protein n=1 Tax=Candidatus Curtissbacteria bacterium GW2011_GWA1_40_24 TaxID=1618406 RepID=A0A0G0U5Q4_9BACT|nr:MAG: hypothetical protein UT92_C0013G0011 [Candidatus Curtissbacteria bacterium GW2011_GWA1_40_24]